MTPSTSAIVGTSSPRSPCNARRAASIAYATDETGSPITANAKATSRIGRLLKIERARAVGIKRGAETGPPPCRPDFPARLRFRRILQNLRRAGKSGRHGGGPVSAPRLIPTARARSIFKSRPILLVAFAFAVMGDPVSSVAYAIEAALRALHGDLGLLVPTMALVLGVIVLVSLNYHQLYARFPEGGGDAAATGAAFGEGWAFLPLGSLIVDYALTIAISVAAGASAIIAYVPGLAPFRILLALGLLVVVASLSWFGHGGRSIFGAMTVGFVAVALVVIARGWLAPVTRGVHAPVGGG